MFFGHQRPETAVEHRPHAFHGTKLRFPKVDVKIEGDPDVLLEAGDALLEVCGERCRGALGAEEYRHEETNAVPEECPTLITKYKQAYEGAYLNQELERSFCITNL